ncbi:MAG TPA: Na+/H+ antiporter NhaC family protein [Thermoanaerobaculaceae bacterium]|nr:Na+/H+ antiporter NhaC family protein [Thermoanaerobaculaceae bacterium]
MKRKSPDVFVIAFALILLAAAATWLLPGGAYTRQQEKVGDATREIVVPGTYHVEPSRPQLAAVFLAPMRGFLRMGAIIGLIFIVGGAFNILNDTGAIAAGIHELVKLLGGRSYLIIPIVMTVFSFFGGAYGMCEEAMPFALIFVPMAIALGYDSLVGICLSFVGAGVGFSAGFLNPFTVQISQGIAGVPLGSGIRYRLLVWVAATVVAIVWVMVYAARVKADPKRSIMYDLDQARRAELEKADGERPAFTWRHGICLVILAGTVVGLIVGSTVLKWYMVEFGGLFFAMGVLSGLAAGIGPSRLAKSFIAGAKDIAGAALIVAFAGGIVVILEDGHILDTILYGMASVTSHFGGVVAAQAMYVLQLILNFFIPSGSTKAVLTMPLLAPLADLSGITRQTLVLAYQLGAGFTSMIIPTSGVTVGTLALAKIPYERWVRWHWPLQAVFVVVSLLALVWPALTRWS